MSWSPPDLTRRELIERTPLAALGAVLPALPATRLPSLDPIRPAGAAVGGLAIPRLPGRVISVHHKSLYRYMSSSPDPARVRQAVDALVTRLTGKAAAADAWASFAGAGDVVGILPDLFGGPRLRTRRVVVDAVVKGLRAAGVGENDIVIWGSSARLLQSSGYRINWSKTGLRCVGADQLGYDGRRSYRLGGGVFGGRSCAIAKIVNSVCRSIINLPVLRDHPVFGCHLAIPNLAIASFQNSGNFARYPGGYPVLGDIASWPEIRQKFVLHIIDGIEGTFGGRMAAGGGSAWRPQLFIGGTDAVAVDRMGFAIIEATRRRNGMGLIAATRRKPRYIWGAERHGAGTATIGRIKETKVQLK